MTDQPISGGWPLFGEPDETVQSAAELYFVQAMSGARTLTQNENRGIARVGHRVSRFIQFSRARLAAAFDGLSQHQQDLLALVPFLLHVNEPNTPGYLKTKFDVHGVSHFEFNESVAQAAASLLDMRGLRKPPEKFRPVFRSVFFETDVGTLAQRDGDAFTFFLIAEIRSLGERVRRDLYRRLEGIRNWLNEQGLLAHFILIDPAWSQEGDFGNVRGEQARGMLLLERFYRNSIFLAGEFPVFWCTTPGGDSEHHQRTSKLTQRVDFDDSISFVDLGFVMFPPVKVRRRAMLGLLNHDAFSPIGFMLEFVLLRYGANASAALCEHLKSRVHKGSDALLFSDPYVLAFDAACVALAHHGEWDKLSFVRKVFFLKSAILSRSRTRGRSGFLREFKRYRGFILRWGWDKEVLTFAETFNRNAASAAEALDREVRDFVLGLYRELAEASRSNSGRFDEKEVAILGRRLVACFGKSGGQMPPQHSYLLHESSKYSELYVMDRPNAEKGQRWAIFTRLVKMKPVPGDEAIFCNDSLSVSLTWLAVNDLANDKTELRLVSPDSLISTTTLREALAQVRDTVGLVDPLVLPSAQFGRSRSVERATMLINFEQRRGSDTPESDRRHYLPSNWDILNYGRNRDSQVRDIAVITRDSWDQVHCRRAVGKSAVRVAMQRIFRERASAGEFDESIRVIVPDGRTQRAVQDRLQQLISTVQQVVDTPTRPGFHRAFAYEVGGRFQVFRRTDERVEIFNAHSMAGVSRLISPSNAEAQNVLIDALSPTLADLSALLERRRTDTQSAVNIGWRTGLDGGYFIVCDETNRIYVRTFQKKHFEEELIRTIRRIIHALKHKVRDIRTLRKHLRIFEMRDGKSQGERSHLYEDTVRLLRVLGEPRQTHPEVFLRGDITKGRDGIWLEYGGQTFEPASLGRNFACQLVERLLRDRAKFAQFDLFIEASTVKFADSGNVRGVRSVVRQLRLIDIYERLLARALKSLKATPSAVMTSLNSFRSSA